MKRLNKLHEAYAIISQSQSRLILLHSLKLKRSDRAFLKADIQEAYDSLDRVLLLIETLKEGAK